MPLRTYFGILTLSKWSEDIPGFFSLKNAQSLYFHRAYVSYNEKSLHVWKPDTEEQIFYVNFFDETKSHTISCIVYSARYHVRSFLIDEELLVVLGNLNRFQIAHFQWASASYQSPAPENPSHQFRIFSWEGISIDHGRHRWLLHVWFQSHLQIWTQASTNAWSWWENSGIRVRPQNKVGENAFVDQVSKGGWIIGDYFHMELT